jgi:hypothetical protein
MNTDCNRFLSGAAAAAAGREIPNDVVTDKIK